MSEAPTRIAAVRGAIQVEENRPERIQAATARLLNELLERNHLRTDQIVSAIFTATPDLDADFPAHAARRLGWTDVPLLGAVEIGVPGALERVVRVLLTVQGVDASARLTPVYLEGAARLRPDLGPAPERSEGAAPPRAATTIAIVGLGQIGGSIGLALAGHGGYRRVGFDANAETRARAVERGAVDVAADSLAEACAGADLAVIAVPVDAIPSCVAEAAEALPAGAALLDTGSARRGITEALARARARGTRAVGGHPIAGNEGRGLDSARAGLFRDAAFALCPVDGAIPPVVEALVADLGARPLLVTPEAHDEALARTSHLPFLIARALHGVGGAAEAQGLSGPTFRDMTRVARSDPRVAEAYCRSNRDAVRRAWERFLGQMEAQFRSLESPQVEQ
jgi:monofunctional chorismate mutase